MLPYDDGEQSTRREKKRVLKVSTILFEEHINFEIFVILLHVTRKVVLSPVNSLCDDIVAWSM